MGYSALKAIAAFVALSLVCTACLVQPIKSVDLLPRIVPLDPNRSEVRYITLGDMGDGGEGQFKTARAMQRVCQQQGCDFVVGLGDNMYPTAPTDPASPDLITKFEQPYAVLGKIDFWMILGNHDWNKLRRGAQAEVNYTLLSDRWRLPNSHYAVPLLPTWLTMYGIDTSLIEAALDLEWGQLGAARRALCKAPGWKILFGHYPTRSGGAHGGNGQWFVRRKLEQLIRECNVHVYLAGHDHHQEHLDLGFYDEIIQGAGGADLSPVITGGAGQKFVASTHGFAWVKVTPAEMHVEFFNADAERIYVWTRPYAVEPVTVRRDR